MSTIELALLQILKWPDDALDTICDRVAESEFGPELEALAIGMQTTRRLANGLGLAAPQVGVCKRIFALEADGVSFVAVNPEITAHSEARAWGEEGCLSFPGLRAPVERWREITLAYQLPMRGDPQTVRLAGLAARVAQHELDHLDGVMFVDRVASRQQRRRLMRKYEKGGSK